jgi:hypothetical protein
LTFLLTFVHHVAHPQGVSHSPSIAITYLIRNHAMSYESDAALAFVKRKRTCAKPNPGFARVLVATRVGAELARASGTEAVHVLGVLSSSTLDGCVLYVKVRAARWS